MTAFVLLATAMRFQRTYEELKQMLLYCCQKSAPTGFQRTYEELKLVYR